MGEISDTSSDFLELFSEGSSENVIDALNSQVYELEHYKNKCHQQPTQTLKRWMEIEQQKQKLENLKGILMSKMPDYLHTIIKYL